MSNCHELEKKNVVQKIMCLGIFSSILFVVHTWTGLFFTCHVYYPSLKTIAFICSCFRLAKEASLVPGLKPVTTSSTALCPRGVSYF